MNPEAKDKWIEALRSKKYRQGFGRLISMDKDGVCYCAQGVLCLALGLEIRSMTEKDGRVVSGFLFNGEVKSLGLGMALKDSLDLDESQTHRIVEMNDGMQYNFDSIADEIEAKF